MTDDFLGDFLVDLLGDFLRDVRGTGKLKQFGLAVGLKHIRGSCGETPFCFVLSSRDSAGNGLVVPCLSFRHRARLRVGGITKMDGMACGSRTEIFPPDICINDVDPCFCGTWENFWRLVVPWRTILPTHVGRNPRDNVIISTVCFL